jgi:uncharacterized protein YkwD
MRKGRFICASLVLLAGFAQSPLSAANGAAPSAWAQQVTTLVNRAREQGRRCGSDWYPSAAPLTHSASLTRAADHHARDMARSGYFEHIAPDGSAPKQRVIRAGYRPRLTGENIAFGPESAAEVVAGWLASPGHCANIMDARFRDSGVAVAQGRTRRHLYWVQVFGHSR